MDNFLFLFYPQAETLFEQVVKSDSMLYNVIKKQEEPTTMRWIVLCLTIFIFGCDQSSSVSAKSPEAKSIEFLDNIYNKRDVKAAMTLVNPRLKDLLKHYHIASSVQRHMLNLPMTNVQFEVDDVDIDFFRKFSTDVKVKVKLLGLKGGEKWMDDRTLRLIKQQGQWVIVDIIPEKHWVSTQ
ncbi:hypothetical protein [Parashewanella hymeniacidonis]|uniref:hypothetical protein n=1 Tax=Parashewanella hymeniacidonis TaxID=2807618 RepID=UPI003084392E